VTFSVRRPLTALWTLVIALALVGATSATLAAQVIQACAANRDGALRLALGGCDLRREAPIDWNQQGPPGPPGPASSIITNGLPIGPVRVVRPGTGCGSDIVTDERTATITLEPGDYRVAPLVSEVLQVSDAAGQSLISLDFNHAVTGARVAISYWRIYDKGQSQILSLNSSSFRLTETTPVLVTMRTQQRECGHAEMAGAVYFDRITLVPLATTSSEADSSR
jgi:hypothetical protein